MKLDITSARSDHDWELGDDQEDRRMNAYMSGIISTVSEGDEENEDDN